VDAAVDVAVEDAVDAAVWRGVHVAVREINHD
jgi:hypothetical protein